MKAGSYKRPHGVRLHLYKMPRIGRSTEYTSGCLGQGEGGEWRVTGSGYEISSGGDENVLNLDCGDGCATV